MSVQFGFGFGYAAWTAAQAGGYAPPQPQSNSGHQQAPNAGGSTATASGGHVVSNSTNGLAGASGGASAAGSHAMPYGGAMAAPVGGFGVFAAAQPMVLSPVFMQLGFPVLLVYPMAAGQPAAGQPSSAAPVDRVPAAAGDQAPAPAVDDEAPAAQAPSVPADDPQPENDRPRVSIGDLNPADFERFRHKHTVASLETTLELELETRDGDRVTLNFSQLDVRERASFRGEALDGERVKLRSASEQTDRLVNMEVDGDLSEAERAAIDRVLEDVLELAREFFGGSFEAAVSKLELMELDSSTLLEFSLQMSMTRRAEITRSGHEALGRLADRDATVMKTLEFFADGQRRLIESARELLDDPSAVKLVQSLLSPLLNSPLLKSPQEWLDASLAKLGERVIEHGPQQIETHDEVPAA